MFRGQRKVVQFSVLPGHVQFVVGILGGGCDAAI
jgi:hypothetical protein